LVLLFKSEINKTLITKEERKMAYLSITELIPEILELMIIPAIFFYLTLQNTLKIVSLYNRTMPPGQVWLLLIPLFYWPDVNVAS